MRSTEPAGLAGPEPGEPQVMGLEAPPAGGHGLAREWQRLRLYGGGALVVLCFALFGWQAWRGREPATVVVQPLDAGGGVEIKVQVSGAVARPGVYRLAQGDRVEDAIAAAGGLTAEADSARLNLAQRVRDEQRLDVPSVTTAASTAPMVVAEPAPASSTPAEPAAPRGPQVTARAGPGGKVNVNTATAAQLEQLPGIGEVSARRIISYRESHGRITSLDQLRQAGISESLLRQAADYLVFE
jgi:competence protein ComEA